MVWCERDGCEMPRRGRGANRHGEGEHDGSCENVKLL